MKRPMRMKSKFSADWLLENESLPLQPILELCGSGRIFVENHNGVSHYSAERIGIRVKFGELEICGQKLRLGRMCGPQLVVLGQIQSITLHRGNA